MDVIIKIKDPILRCFLSALFRPRDGGYAVDMDSLTGAAICSLVKESPDRRLSAAEDRTAIRFYLPDSRYTSELRGRFLYVPSESQAKINSVLRKEFDMRFLSYCTEKRIQGLKIKDIIPLFIVEHNLDVFDGDVETLKKRFYREEIKLLSKMRETLRQKAYYRARKLKK